MRHYIQDDGSIETFENETGVSVDVTSTLASFIAERGAARAGEWTWIPWGLDSQRADLHPDIRFAPGDVAPE